MKQKLIKLPMLRRETGVKRDRSGSSTFFVLPIYSVAPTLCKSVMYLKNIFNLKEEI